MPQAHGAATSAAPCACVWVCGHAGRVPLPDGLHLGELLEEGVVVLEGGFAHDGVRDVVRGKSAAQLSQFARLPDRPTLSDPNRLYATLLDPTPPLRHRPAKGGRGKCAAHGEGETPAQGGKPNAAVCRQENLSEKRRARFGQRSCPRLARSVGSSANHAKQIGRTSPAFHRTDFATHPARPRTDSPAFYRTNFARAPARQSDGLTFGIPSPAFPRTDFARIRKADADSTIPQPRYGRNQPPRNHEPTILRVEYKNDSDTTILYHALKPSSSFLLASSAPTLPAQFRCAIPTIEDPVEFNTSFSRR